MSLEEGIKEVTVVPTTITVKVPAMDECQQQPVVEEQPLSTTTTTTTTTSTSTSTMGCCPICMEELVVEQRPVTLTGCNHTFCSPCAQSWFEHQEKTYSGNNPAQTTPIINCPHCRQCVNEDDIIQVLGRRAQERPVDSNNTTTPSSASDQPMDEFTRTYLEEQGAKQCPDCGIWILLEDGCNHMMCRCGCRFCYCCGRRGMPCNQYGVFFNNVINQEERKTYQWDPETESVAGDVWPLFLDGDDGDDWFEHWYGGEDAPVWPLFFDDHSRRWRFRSIYWVEHWFDIREEYQFRTIEPLFEGSWLHITEREPVKRLRPLFVGGDWDIDGNIEMIHNITFRGLKKLAGHWKAAMLPCPEDGGVEEINYYFSRPP